IGGLPDLAILGGNGSSIGDDAALVISKRIQCQHAGRGLGTATKRADQINGDDLFEISHWEMAELAAVLLAAGGLGGADNAGGIDQDPLLAVGGARPGKGGIDL